MIAVPLIVLSLKLLKGESHVFCILVSSGVWTSAWDSGSPQLQNWIFCLCALTLWLLPTSPPAQTALFPLAVSFFDCRAFGMLGKFRGASVYYLKRQLI